MSAPARAWLTAVRASSSSVASLSTEPSSRSDAAVAVGRVLAQAHVGEDQQLGHGLLDRARGQLHDALVVPGARAVLVLLGRDRRTASPRRGRARRPRGPPRRPRDSDSRSTPGIDAIGSRRGRRARVSSDEQRQHELRGPQVGLAHQPAQSGAGAQPAHARLWKGHALLRLEAPGPAGAGETLRQPRCDAGRSGRGAEQDDQASRCTSETPQRRRGAVDRRVERLQGGLEREHERDHADHVVGRPPTDPAGTSARRASGSESRQRQQRRRPDLPRERADRDPERRRRRAPPPAQRQRATAPPGDQSSATKVPMPASIASPSSERAAGGQQHLLGDQQRLARDETPQQPRERVLLALERDAPRRQQHAHEHQRDGHGDDDGEACSAACGGRAGACS